MKPTAAGGRSVQGGFAIIHKGEEIVPNNNKNINLSLKLNLKATMPSTLSGGELRDLARRLSEVRTKELYRRQTTLL